MVKRFSYQYYVIIVIYKNTFKMTTLFKLGHMQNWWKYAIQRIYSVSLLITLSCLIAYYDSREGCGWIHTDWKNSRSNIQIPRNPIVCPMWTISSELNPFTKTQVIHEPFTATSWLARPAPDIDLSWSCLILKLKLRTGQNHRIDTFKCNHLLAVNILSICTRQYDELCVKSCLE